MSTRGSVAWTVPDGTHKGVYIHNCSQPSAAGARVYARAIELGLEGLIGDITAGAGSEILYDPFADPLSLEWVYVLKPDQGLIEVWAHALYSRARSLNVKRWSGITYMARCSGNVYTHVHVADVRVPAPEPDWKALEDLVKAMALTD